MTDLHLNINAIDTLMFRDGRPFNQNDAGASEAASVFPPWPPTVVGAVRAALWKQLPNGKWDAGKLGSGTNWQDKNCPLDGKLRFAAPLLLYNGGPVFPVPLHIIEGRNKADVTKLSKLAPGDARNCDLGDDVRLPAPHDDTLVGIKTIEKRWVTLAGMKQILRGGVPDDDHLIRRTDLWRAEPRVGIGIDRKSRTTSDGHLYMATHIRMADGVKLRVSVKGWTGGKFITTLRSVAGEHRMAQMSSCSEVILPKSINPGKDKLWLAIALSPVVLDFDEKTSTWSVAGLPSGNIVSACLGKAVSIGGWNSEARQPIPLRRCIPAGSVWFMKGGQPPSSIGQATDWGFGQILTGTWQEKQ